MLIQKNKTVHSIDTIESERNDDEKVTDNIQVGNKKRFSSRAMMSFVRDHNRGVEVERPDFGIYGKNSKIYELMSTYLGYSKEDLMRSILYHMEFSLARSRFSLNRISCMNASALSVKDRILEIWNDTQMHIMNLNPKRIYFMSTEYLIGRSLQNALLNMEMEKEMKDALLHFGMRAEDLYEMETDAGQGIGGLGRLAACMLDSFATLNYPAWGYGIRYSYGSFKQKIVNGEQVELPDYWMSHSNPWEIERFDIKYKVKFYGNVRKSHESGVERSVWENFETVTAMAYDTPIPGYNTFNSVNLRLWKSLLAEDLDHNEFSVGSYYDLVDAKQRAEVITTMLYPNDSTPTSKELRLKQQYFFVSASIQDIIRRFRKSNSNWKGLQDKVAIQLNETHPALGIIELLRILVDEEHFDFLLAWNIVINVFSFTNHTTLPEALDKWGIDLFGRVLPRHLELIYLINFFWIQKVSDMHPNDLNKISSLSLVEEGPDKFIRMGHLSIIGSHKVNGVARVHSEILKTKIFKDFYDVDPGKFTNITNGVTVRRWIRAANPGLADLYTKHMASSEWLVNYGVLRELLDKAANRKFQREWEAVKEENKARVVKWVNNKFGIKISSCAMFDVSIKKIHEYKRQFMFCLYILHRYLAIKKTKPGNRHKFVERVFFMGGKAASGYVLGKQIIKFAHKIMDVVNNDSDIGARIKFVFVPNYNVSKAELLIPAADLTEQISTAGTEASGTSNMKFVMNGALIIGTMDGANIEIAEEIDERNMFIFGKGVDEVEETRQKVS